MGIYNCAATLSEALDSILTQTYTNWNIILCDDGSTDDTYLVGKDIIYMDSKNIKFSIIIPVYNAEKYLYECISSILCQTYKNFQLILINDGSTDNSYSICQRFVSIDTRVKVLHQKNSGASEARNQGISNADGDYIIFLDSDDWWIDDKVLQTIHDRIKKTLPDVLSFNFSKYMNEKICDPYFSLSIESMPEQYEDTIEYIFKYHLWVSGAWNKVIRKKLFNKDGLRFKSGITSEDIDWSLRLAMRTEKFDYIQDVIYVYRQNPLSVSHTPSLSKLHCLEKNIEQCEKLVESEKDNNRLCLFNSYIAYQYGTLLYCVAELSGEDQKAFIPTIKRMQYLTEYSDDNKIKIIHLVRKTFGLSAVLYLLHFYKTIRDKKCLS